MIVRESAEFASATAAEQHGLPHARVATAVAMVEELRTRNRGARARRAGVPESRRAGGGVAVPDLLAGADRSVSVRGSALPPSGRRRAVVSRSPTGGPATSGPLVYISFGDVAATFPPAVQVYASALEAVAELPIRVLLSTGGNEVELGEVPPERPRRGAGSASRTSSRTLLRWSATAAAGTTLSAMSAGCPARDGAALRRPAGERAAGGCRGRRCRRADARDRPVIDACRARLLPGGRAARRRGDARATARGHLRRAARARVARRRRPRGIEPLVGDLPSASR